MLELSEIRTWICKVNKNMRDGVRNLSDTNETVIIEWLVFYWCTLHGFGQAYYGSSILGSSQFLLPLHLWSYKSIKKWLQSNRLLLLIEFRYTLYIYLASKLCIIKVSNYEIVFFWWLVGVWFCSGHIFLQRPLKPQL